MKPNTSNFSGNFLAFVEYFLAFAKNFLALQKTCHEQLKARQQQLDFALFVLLCG
jgi:hypothetical protein